MLKNLTTKSVQFLFCFFAISFSFAANNPADKEVPANEITATKVPVKLTNDLSRLDEMKVMDMTIARFLKKWNVAGASVALVKDGKLLYAKGFGVSDLDTREAVQPSHIFRVASISKLITAVAIMKLHEEQKLHLDNPVFGPKGILNDSIYSYYSDPRIPEITVRHLLQHQGGWSRKGDDPMFMPLEIAKKMGVQPPASEEVVIRYVLTKPLDFSPGTVSNYSNVGYAILGEVIKKVSGMPYETYLQSNILNQLDIYNMKLGKSRLDQRYKDEVRYYDYSGYSNRPSCFGTGQLAPRTYEGTYMEALGSAGGWLASASDLMRFMVAIDGLESKPDFLSKESVELMTRYIATISPIGWRAVKEDGTWWRTGTLSGTSAIMMRQNDGISWAFIVNTSTNRGAGFTDEIKKVMNQAIYSIREWPDQDLFEKYKVVHISPKAADINWHIGLKQKYKL